MDTEAPSHGDDRRGHRIIGHTADVVIEAWAPDFDGCCEEAVAGLVDVYAGSSAHPVDAVTVQLPDDGGEERLAHLLDEVIFLLDTNDRPPVAATVKGRTAVIELGTHLTGTGAVPKAIPRSGFVVEERSDAVRCRFVVDV